MRHRTRGGDAVDGATYGTNGSLSGFDDGFDQRPARITVKGAWLLAVSLYQERLQREVVPAFAGRVLPFDLDASAAYAALMARAKAADAS